jgi:hypothetical protein
MRMKSARIALGKGINAQGRPTNNVTVYDKE